MIVGKGVDQGATSGIDHDQGIGSGDLDLVKEEGWFLSLMIREIIKKTLLSYILIL